MLARLASASLAAACLAVLAASCASTDVTLATLPAPDEAGGAPLRCAGNDDCPQGYCDKASCDAPSGTCEVPDPDCLDDGHPRCGCDHVTYFNDCTRRAAGVSYATQGSCQPGNDLPCGGPFPLTCPGLAVCARPQEMTPGPCDDDPVGSCWVLPTECPADASRMWDSCQPGGEHCMDTCSAIRSRAPYKHAAMCP